MLKFYKALNCRANELNDHEIQAPLEKLYLSRKLEYFQNTKIYFFLINVNKFQYSKVYFEKVQQNPLDRNCCTVKCLILPSKYYTCVFVSAVARTLKGC